MTSQKLPTSASQLPEKWRPKYLLKRIGEEDLTISLETRDEILRQLAGGGRFVQIGEYTIMLNGIKSIDPFWRGKNVPPRPIEVLGYEATERGFGAKITNQTELDEWEKCFGKQLIEAWAEK